MVNGESPVSARRIINCPNCGAITYSDRERCAACGVHLQKALARKDAEAAEDEKTRVHAEPELTREQQAFLRRYSFGPGFPLYLFTTPFWFVPVVCGFVSHFAAGTAGGVLVSSIYMLFLIWFGFPARRVRWKFNKWKSFEVYVKSETTWNFLGVLGWLLSVLCVITVVAAALSRSAAQ